MILQRMIRIEDEKKFTGFLDQKPNGSVHFNYWDPEYDNGKWDPKGRWMSAYIQQFKPDF